VVVTEDAVHVCTAGDIRVHLVRGGSVVRSTRDHVLANESPEWVRATYGGVPLGHHATMVTRTLGSCALPPEKEEWPAKSPFSVLVCSSAHHRHREPNVYAEELLAAALREDEPLEEGVLARIET
jgi:hypothetical protein